MSLFDTICGSPVNVDSDQYSNADPTATYECNYDTNPTSLYQAMESQAWVPTLEFFKTGKWSTGVEDPISAKRQARTWVTRFEGDDSIRWSQLPIHAALIFGAPFQIVETLLDLYPQGARCTDDQHMLPLHLAIKFGAEDNVVSALIDWFPDALFSKDIRGRLPMEIESSRKDRSNIICDAVRATAKTLQRQQKKEEDVEVVILKAEISELKEEIQRMKEASQSSADSKQVLADLKQSASRGSVASEKTDKSNKTNKSKGTIFSSKTKNLNEFVNEVKTSEAKPSVLEKTEGGKLDKSNSFGENSMVTDDSQNSTILKDKNNQATTILKDKNQKSPTKEVSKGKKKRSFFRRMTGATKE